MPTRLGGHLQTLLAAVQGAASLAEVQRAYVETVGAVIDARAHGIYWFPRGDRTRMRLEVRGAAEDFIAEYERVGPTGDPVLGALLRARRPVRSDELMPPERWRRLPFHATLARAGLEHTLQAPVLHGGVLVGTLNVARPAAAPQFDARDALVLGLVSVHVAAAYRRAERFDALVRRASAPSSDALEVLSAREREVSLLVVAGLSNREVAAALGVAESTVKEHLKRIFRKLGVANRQELTRVTLQDRDRQWPAPSVLSGG
jgi:DNA-binding CsgD family transcriptional regulator